MASIIIADENLSLWGKYHEENDSWVYLPELKTAFETFENISAHELVIMGYDDDAVAIDQNGEAHQGLLILRNSWGPNAGDHGNFYMAYDYFNAFAFDVLRIRN
jgi:C1A family cysteine protease